MESPTTRCETLAYSESDIPISTKFDVRARNRKLQNSPAEMQTRDINEVYRPGDLIHEALEHDVVWKVYNDESAKADEALSEAAHRSIDILLIFTGLFATVLTTFIVQLYQILVQGLPQPVSPITSSSATLSMEQLQRVNILWFASLAFSLCNAAVCMLGKQWLQPTGRDSHGSSPRFRARQRQRRYMQIRAWQILTVIDSLPFFLHVSLLLFFAGLVILVWTINRGIAIMTGIIVVFVYACYLASIWLSLAHADSPYRHPLSDRIRSWWARSYNSFPSIFAAERDIEKSERSQHKPEDADRIGSVPISIVTPEDALDAHALIWLFNHCPNDATTSIALQAIGGLPRHFTAFHILRHAGAIPLILRGFRTCFYKDWTLDSQWLILQPQDAAKYCQSWMRLTCGTSIKWSHDLTNLLETLRKAKNDDNASAIAACTRAVAFSDVRDGRMMLSSYLARHVAHRTQLSQETQCWLLETFLQCSLTSTFELRPAIDIGRTTVPIFINLLHHHRGGDTTASNVRSAIALGLSYTTGRKCDPIFLNDEPGRRQEFYNHLIPSLAAIVDDPEFFGVDEYLLNQMASDFVHVAIQIRKRQSKSRSRFRFRSITQMGLSKLYLQGRIDNGNTSDEDLSEVLQIIFPPDLVLHKDRPLFVKSLIQTISRSTQSPVLLDSALRLLEPLLVHAQPAILDAFVESDGGTVLLNLADIGDMDSRALQLSCIRNICLFVQNAAENPENDPATSEAHLNHIFHLPFLHKLTTLFANGSFWSPEIPQIWVPALLTLCKIHPYDTRWKGVEAALRKFTRGHDYAGKHGYYELTQGLDSMKALINGNQQ